MQVIGRADHHQVVGAGGEQGLRRLEGAAHGDARVRQDRRADRGRVALGGEVEAPAHLLHGGQDVGDALAKADDADAPGLHDVTPKASG
ncbi:MAG: hypothetical protein ABS77_10680 [Phenylobacterium sp. SCN 69-14]|nr:MAG: hypothetical protein ABS77_10680 [Phenylobacterium sp. SCN 69-14]